MERLMNCLAVGTLAISLASIAACETPEGEDGFTATDSAGISIVENGEALRAQIPSWSHEAVPTLVIEPVGENDIVLFQATQVSTLHNGILAVTNGGGTEVLLFSEGGDFLRTVGRPGEGPGEFRRISSVFPIPGDSFGVYDGSIRRLSVYDEEGRFGRDLSLKDLPKGFGSTWIRPLGPHDLAFMTRGGFQSEPPEGTYRTFSEWIRIDLDGQILASFGEFPGNELFQNSRVMGSPFFAMVTSATTLPDALVVGVGDSAEIRLYDLSGSLSTIVRWFHEPESVTDDLLSIFFEAALATVPEAERAQAQAMLDGMPKNDVVPPYSSLISSPDGMIWVGSYFGVGSGVPGDRHPARNWLIFDSDGVLQAEAESPAGFQPNVLVGQTMIGVFKDELGVESIRGYTFSIGAGG